MPRMATTTSISMSERPRGARGREVSARTACHRERLAVRAVSTGWFLAGIRLGRAAEHRILLFQQLLDLAQLANRFVALFNGIGKRRLSPLGRSATAAVKP